MSVAARRAWLPLVALVLGVFGDQMLAVPFGLGTALGTVAWVGAFVATHRETLGRSRLAAAAAALTAAVGLAWRDSPTLHALDILLLLASCGFLATGTAQAASLLDLAHRVGRSAVLTTFGGCALLGRIPWGGVRNGRSWRLALSAAGGLLVAFPIVLIFTILLANADPIFGQRLEQLFSFEISDLVRHVILAAALSWFAAGFLYAGESTAAARPARPSWLATGAVEAAIVLALVDLLFGGFVWVQIRYLFGSREWVDTIAGLTYSQYARRGFFELVTVTALALPLLLAAHWVVRPDARGRRVVLGLAGVQVALVLVMLVSAMERMRLYQAEYGQTELRFYTTAFMLWLAVLLGSFLLTVLPGRRDLFAHAAVLTAWVAVAVLHAVNPDERIVLANRTAPNGFDVAYGLSLSADAVPALLATSYQLDPSARATIEQSLRPRAERALADWRTWNLSRLRAARAVGAVP
ncbi:MAG: DUF4173 domain-containing protein [Vicinamibacteria bacterium]